IRILQRLNCAGVRGDINFWNLVSMVLRSNAVDSAALQVPYLMPTHSWIVPIRNKKRTIWSYADIRGSEPLVFMTFHNVYNACIISSTVFCNWIGSYYAWAGIGMNHLIPKDFRKQSAFINCHPSR